MEEPADANLPNVISNAAFELNIVPMQQEPEQTMPVQPSRDE